MKKSRQLPGKNNAVSSINKRLYGSLRNIWWCCVYDDIYEPAHLQTDELGFCFDAINLVRRLNAPITNDPGGNSIAFFNLKDGIEKVDSL